MKIVITGAYGYIGRHVVKEALDQGHKVIAVDLNHKDIDDRAILSDVDIFSGDNTIFESLGSPELCIHMAWKDGFIHNSPEHMSNVSRHFTFLSHLINKGCKNIAGTMREARSSPRQQFSSPIIIPSNASLSVICWMPFSHEGMGSPACLVLLNWRRNLA